jgi:hypothetical protein
MLVGRSPAALVLTLAVQTWLVATAQGTVVQSSVIDTDLLSTLGWSPIGPERANVSSVAVDASFPYRVCATDADGDTRCGLAPGGSGMPSTWEVLPTVGEGRVTPDPLDPEVLFTSLVRRFDRRTGQSTWTGPEVAEQLRGRPLPATLLFSPDGRTLLAGRRSIWRTSTAGQTWTLASPDLIALSDPDDADGTISAMAVSPIDSRVLWAGTSRGTVHVTRDAGSTWTTVTPPFPTPVAATGIEASRFDPQSVYVTIAGGASAGPSIWRTRSLGATWVNVGTSLPAGLSVRTVREDPFRRGLLFAAADGDVLFSIDDGERWQPLGTNLPRVPVMDLAIRDSALVVGTRGRGVWLLEDFSPLRQVTADVLKAEAFLFRPAQTWRLRASGDAGTPVTPDVAVSAGASIFYLVSGTVTEPLSIDIIETATGDVIRRFSTEDAERQPGDPRLSRGRGLQRVVWDLRYARPEAAPSAPQGARVLPGTYQVRLSTGARAFRQSIAVRLDPRVRTSAVDLSAQRTLARSLDQRRAQVARALDARVANRTPGLDTSLELLLEELRRLTRAVNDVDARPSAAVEAAAADALARAAVALDTTR